MLTSEENELLTQVGPDTPMGKVLRRYWFPAFLLSDLPVPDCPPIGVQVLGENFVAFRDTNGRVGFIDELCCHRGASLTYGRVEECGIRCIYHGWKFDVEGNVLETPNGGNSRVKDHVKQGSYPVVEAGGLGWVYIGPPGTEPALPHFPWMDLPADQITASEVVFDCNWMQVQEGSLDSSHLGIMHVDGGVVMAPGPPMIGSLRMDGIHWTDKIQPPGAAPGMPTPDNDPVIEVENTPFGFQYCAIRKMSNSDDKYVRIAACTLPYVVHITSTRGAVIVVPRDDETCSTLSVGGRRPNQANRLSSPREPTADQLRQFRFPSDSRRYTLPPQDRRAMLSKTSFAGWRDGGRPQDASVQGVNGRLRIYHRRTEHLVQADSAIVRLRHLLLDSIKRLENGEQPHGLGEFDYRTIQSASGVIGPNDRWQDLVANNKGQVAELNA